MNLIKILNLLPFILIFSLHVSAQEGQATDFSDEIGIYDLSNVWVAESFFDIGEDSTILERPEPIGFIGDNYQRFYIHFISAIKVPGKQNEYLVYGKTRVKGNICSFQGSIRVKKAEVYNQYLTKGYYSGIATCTVNLYEDSKQAHSGMIKGTLKTGFMLNGQGYFGYDGLGSIADGFCNNQFTGTWVDYKTWGVKKCHWGDYRIPDCGDLDIGAEEFSVADKYEKNGWENYYKAWGDPDDPIVKKARKEEEREWWKD